MTIQQKEKLILIRDGLLFATIVVFVVLVFWLTGCATRERIVTQEVYIPVACDIPAPNLAEMPDNTPERAAAVVEYITKLETFVKICQKVDKK